VPASVDRDRLDRRCHGRGLSHDNAQVSTLDAQKTAAPLREGRALSTGCSRRDALPSRRTHVAPASVAIQQDSARTPTPARAPVGPRARPHLYQRSLLANRPTGKIGGDKLVSARIDCFGFCGRDCQCQPSIPTLGSVLCIELTIGLQVQVAVHISNREYISNLRANCDDA
jgi:hypothetical protein